MLNLSFIWKKSALKERAKDKRSSLFSVASVTKKKESFVIFFTQWNNLNIWMKLYFAYKGPVS